MEVFRICQESFATQLFASGNPNRWNLGKQFVIYTGASRSLSTLELVVHAGSIVPALKYKVMVISIPDDDISLKQILTHQLPKNWRTLAAYPDLQTIGSNWYNSQDSLVLKVPSAIIPLEYNYIINTNHKEFSTSVKLVRTEDYFWDNRLY